MSDLFVARQGGPPVTSHQYYEEMRTAEFKKAAPPRLGNKHGDWAGRDLITTTLPGGAIMQFDLSKLGLSDYRMMRDHYQINSSLSLLSFILHQLDWRIECDNQKIADAIENNLREMWTRLIRALSQAYPFGFSPIAIDWENNPQTGYIEVGRFKDLIPEDCTVNWKTVEGYSSSEVKPKFKEYDGIKQRGLKDPIPVLNSLWYPLLMENGDYYGKKLLKPAFPPWFFSILVHLFANRYFERFGEPTPIGRADFDATLHTGTGTISGRDAMLTALMNLRSRGVVLLPSDRDPDSGEYEYDIEYLESQMRGVDFERYLARLDEEMSLSIFTPVLLFRTGGTGSYNLGVQHMQMFLWMLNSLAGDLKEYIDRYVVRRWHDFNFGPNAPKAQWTFRLMGKESAETIRAMMTEVLRHDYDGKAVRPDLGKLAVAVGVPLELVDGPKDTQVDPMELAEAGAAAAGDGTDTRDRQKPGKESPAGVGSERETEKPGQ